MTFTGDETADINAAHDAAARLAEYVAAQLATGVSPAALASAMLGLAVDLLGSVVGVATAARTVNRVAFDLLRSEHPQNTTPSISKH